MKGSESFVGVSLLEELFELIVEGSEGKLSSSPTGLALEALLRFPRNGGSFRWESSSGWEEEFY